jgi:hypothetical protein
MQDVIASLVSALKRERAKNAELQHQLQKLQSENGSVSTPSEPLGSGHPVGCNPRQTG